MRLGVVVQWAWQCEVLVAECMHAGRFLGIMVRGLRGWIDPIR